MTSKFWYDLIQYFRKPKKSSKFEYLDWCVSEKLSKLVTLRRLSLYCGCACIIKLRRVLFVLRCNFWILAGYTLWLALCSIVCLRLCFFAFLCDKIRCLCRNSQTRQVLKPPEMVSPEFKYDIDAKRARTAQPVDRGFFLEIGALSHYRNFCLIWFYELFLCFWFHGEGAFWIFYAKTVSFSFFSQEFYELHMLWKAARKSILFLFSFD